MGQGWGPSFTAVRAQGLLLNIGIWGHREQDLTGGKKAVREIHTHTHTGLRKQTAKAHTGMFTWTDMHALSHSCTLININLSTYSSTHMVEEITAETATRLRPHHLMSA